MGSPKTNIFINLTYLNLNGKLKIILNKIIKLKLEIIIQQLFFNIKWLFLEDLLKETELIKF
jgi:hypothetical protein